MRTLLATILTSILFATAAAAESFTLEAVASAPDSMSTTLRTGETISYLFQEATARFAMKSGKDLEFEVRCRSATPASPSDNLDSRGICQNIDHDGHRLDLFYACDFTDPAGPVGNCWGYFTGGTGKFSDASGTISWFFDGDPETQTGTAVGGGELLLE